ncbi:MAG: pyridoxine 5'-phosphate synthase, partial [Bdellovibrionales bacterium]|nr:pyridoxine 5'-phosphate synthase [Bdellovibrionales bacterium]
MNKIATLRNARGGTQPNVVQVARDALRFGAHGITVHPRPDGRHIRREDVYALKAMIGQFNDMGPDYREYNIEGYPAEEFMALVEEVRPDQVTLVPDPPDVLTSNAGWKVSEHVDFLKSVCHRLQ